MRKELCLSTIEDVTFHVDIEYDGSFIVIGNQTGRVYYSGSYDDAQMWRDGLESGEINATTG